MVFFELPGYELLSSLGIIRAPRNSTSRELAELPGSREADIILVRFTSVLYGMLSQLPG